LNIINSTNNDTFDELPNPKQANYQINKSSAHFCYKNMVFLVLAPCTMYIPALQRSCCFHRLRWNEHVKLRSLYDITVSK